MFIEFAIENLSEMMGYIAKGNLNIRIHREMSFLLLSELSRNETLANEYFKIESARAFKNIAAQ